MVRLIVTTHAAEVRACQCPPIYPEADKQPEGQRPADSQPGLRRLLAGRSRVRITRRISCFVAL